MISLEIPFKLFIVIWTVTSILAPCSKARDSKSTVIDDMLKDKDSPTVILREKRTIKYEDLPLSIRKRLAENLDTIADYEDSMYDDKNDYYENLNRVSRDNSVETEDLHNIDKREVIQEEENIPRSEHGNDVDSIINQSRVKKSQLDVETVKKNSNLSKAKSELEKVQKKVEDEIQKLKKRSKSSHSDSKKRQISPNLSPRPHLLKIEVDTFEIGQGIPTENLSNKDKEFTKLNAGEKDFRRDVSLPSNVNETIQNNRTNDGNIDMELQKKLDALKEKVKRQVEEEAKIKEIEANNAKYDELMELVDNAQVVTNENEENQRSKRLDGSDSDFEYPEDLDKVDQRESDTANSLQRSIRKRSTDLGEYDDDDDVEEEIKFRRKGNSKTRKFKKASPLHIPKAKRNQYSHRIGKGTYLFPGRLRTREGRKFNYKNRNSQKKRGGRKSEYRVKKDTKYGRKERFERAADEPLDEIQSDSVAAEFDSMADIANSQDVGSQLGPQYQETFGGLPNEPGLALTRYKRIRRNSDRTE